MAVTCMLHAWLAVVDVASWFCALPAAVDVACRLHPWPPEGLRAVVHVYSSSSAPHKQFLGLWSMIQYEPSSTP